MNRHQKNKSMAALARRLRLIGMRQAGMTFAAIGKAEGISTERVRQLIAAGERQLRRIEESEKSP